MCVDFFRKMFRGIINHILTQYCDCLEIVTNEHNGFRKDRSCVDHICVLPTVIKNIINNKLDTYCALIDFKLSI